MNTEKQLTAVEWLYDQIKNGFNYNRLEVNGYENQRDRLFEQAKEVDKQEKIQLLKSLVYSVCIGDDVEDVEEWLKEHELNKSE